MPRASIQQYIFGERGKGAKPVGIRFLSLNNVKCGVRLKIPWFEISTGNKGVLNYPASEEKLLKIIFSYSPGWNKYILIDSLLTRKKRMLKAYSENWNNASIEVSKILNGITFNHIMGLLKAGSAEF